MRQLVHGRRDDVAAPWQRTAAGSNLLGDDGGLGVTIFEEMTTLAARTGAINLGQGFPDEDGPAEIEAAAMAAIRNGANQYAPGKGTLTLRTAVAHHQERFYGLTPDPETEIIVTTGATEAMAAPCSALTGPGDEVLTFEPFYDSYGAIIGLCRRPARHRPAAGSGLSCPTWTHSKRPSRSRTRWCWSTTRTTPPAACSPARC